MKKNGFIGLGIIGKPMVRNLLKKALPLQSMILSKHRSKN